MTVPATPRRTASLSGDGVQVSFPFTFAAYADTDVRVVVLNEITQVESNATLGVDYNVTLNPDQDTSPGGSVVFGVAPTTDERLTILGGSPYSQETALPDGGQYRAENVERAFDMLSFQIQQLLEAVERCAQVPVNGGDAEDLNAAIAALVANLDTLNAIAANIGDLIVLAGDIASVNALAPITAELQAVAAIAAQVVAVASISAEVQDVSANMAAVQNVSANMASILIAVANLPALAGKANSGANSDITSLSGLTTPLSVGQGGTGLTTVMQKHISGLVMSTAGASTTMSVSPGQAADTTAAAYMTLAATIAKTTAAWAVGNAQGGLDTGAIANNTWYHFHLIRRPDTGVVDVLASLSPTAPTLPANYTQFRRIGSGRTNGAGQWTAFLALEDSGGAVEFLWLLPTLDVNTQFAGITGTNYVVNVPTGIRVAALGHARVNTSGNGAGAAYFRSPELTDVQAYVAATAPMGTVGVSDNGTATVAMATVQARVRTNTSAQIRASVNIAGNDTVSWATIGWQDARR